MEGGGGPRSIFANFTIYINLRSLNLIVVPPSRPSRFSHGISISNEIRHYLHSISCADPPKNFQWVKIPREEFFFFDGGDVRGPFSVTVLFKNLRNLHLIVVSAAPPPGPSRFSHGTDFTPFPYFPRQCHMRAFHA